MLEIARNATASVQLKNEANGYVLPYTPAVFVGGTGVSGPTFVDNARYRRYVFEQFEARCLDMETAAAAHIAYQNGIPFLFFRSLSDLAGADQNGNTIGVFFSVAAENAFTVAYAFIDAMYPSAVPVTSGATKHTYAAVIGGTVFGLLVL
jgi:adenosylhomocysteine nucleosidase